jgi:SAM-dependent methyltransferase
VATQVPDHPERLNRRFWDADADAYQAEHAAQFDRDLCAWGVWGVPEAELGVLGEVAGRDVLELGCGSAQWAVGLAARGARVAALDQSAVQLRHAAARVKGARAAVALVLASATATPFADASFDVVFCDHGALTFCDPRESVPEVARVLRPGGLLAFNGATRLLYWTYDARRDAQTRTLRNTGFGRRSWFFGDGTVDYSVSEGEWLRLFATHGLVPEDLVELRPERGATTTFVDYAPYELARRWPLEQVWKVRKPR